MASRKIRDEVMMMTIAVNSEPAQQAIYELRKENVKYAETIEDLQRKKDVLGRKTKANAEEYDNLTRQIKENQSAIERNKDRMEEMRRSLDITKMTMGQLKKEAELLNRQLREAIPNTPQAKDLSSRLAEIRGRIAEVNTGAKQTSLSFQNLADRFNHYSGIVTAVMAVLIGFGISVQQIIDRNNKMADAMSGVEKTTGMARKEVEELTRSFSDFDTRTKKVDLLKIAEVGGRLGVAKSDISDFVREVDKANVALGDSWEGGVEKMTDSLGRIINLFKETKDQEISQSINQIGSALNELAAQGASSEQNIADFLLRTGNMPGAMKPSLNTLLGFGSAFEEFGVNSEIASSGFAKFIRVAANNVEGFATVMNRSTKEVRDLINTDPAEFFLQFSEGLKGLDGDQVARVLDKLKLSDNEVQKAIGAATEGSYRFRDSVELASQAVKEGTSLQEEFNKVNNNAAAIWEKTQRKIAELFTSAVVSKFISSTVEAFGKFIGAIEDADGNITRFRGGLLFAIKVMGVMIATVISYNLVTGVYNALMKTATERVLGLTIVEKLRNAVMVIGNGLMTTYRATMWLLGAGYSLLTGNVTAATFAMRGFTATIAANPLGAILTVVTLAASAYFAFADSAEDATKKQKSFNDVMKEGSANAAQEITSLEILYKTATNVKLSTEERMKAVQKLKSEFPGYFGQINDEIIMNGKASKSYHELRAAIVASARAKAAQAELEKREADRLKEDVEWRRKYAEEVRVNAEISKRGGGSTTTRMDGGDGKSFTVTMQNSDLLEASNQRLKNMEKERYNNKVANAMSDKIYYDSIEANNKRAGLYNEGKDGTTTSNYNVPSGSSSSTGTKKNTGSGSNTNADQQHQREMEAMLRRGEQSAELARQIQLDIEDAKIEAMEEGAAKEMAALDLQEKRKLEEIDKKKIGQTELDAIQRKIDSAKDGDKKVFEALKQSWLENNANLDNLKLEHEKIFDLKRKTLSEKNMLKYYSDKDAAKKKEIEQLKVQQNEELGSWNNLEEMKAGLRKYYSDVEISKITTWGEGKEALNKVYQQKELDMLTEHLQDMLSTYEGIDLSVLTPEQAEIVRQNLEIIRAKLAEVKAEKNGLANSETGGLGKGPGKPVALGGGQTDVLGFSAEQWTALFTNTDDLQQKLGKVAMAIQLMQNAYAQYYEFVKAGEAAQMRQVEVNARRKEQRLKQMLSRGEINQEQYEEEIRRLQEQTEKKKAKLEYEAAKRQKAMNIANAIASTALAVLNALQVKPFFPVGLAMAAIATGMGALQVATIARQPLPEAPGAEQGFGMEYDIRREQDGKQFNVVRKPLRSGEVYRPTHFIAGENGVEMVIDSPTYTRFRPEVKRILHNEIQYSRGYEGGYYPYLQNQNGNSNDEYYLSIISNNTKAMNAILDKKFTAHIGETMDNAKGIIKITDEYNGYKNAAKKG